MRVLLTAALAIVCATVATAQSASFLLATEPLGPSYNETDVRNLTPVPATSNQPETLDFADFLGSYYYAIKVTPYIQISDYGRANGISTINTWVSLSSGFVIYTGFTVDESGFNQDDRKNARSHPIPGALTPLGLFDGAGNARDYRNHDLLWWQRGGNVSGPAAFGKVIFPQCGFLSLNQAVPLYSFVALIPREIGTYEIGFVAGPDNITPNDTRLRTGIFSNSECRNDPDWDGIWVGEVVGGRERIRISVVPEPSSVLVIGWGLFGLVFQKRFRCRA